MRKVALILGIVFLILTFAGGGYVLINHGQVNVPDHVGIVERVENGMVYTVEGNTSDSYRQRSYSVGHYEIWGYGTPIY